MNSIIFHDPEFQQWAFLQVPMAVVAFMFPFACFWLRATQGQGPYLRPVMRIINWQLVGVYANWFVQLIGWSFFWDFMQGQEHEAAKQTTFLVMQIYFGAFAVFIGYLYARVGLRRALGVLPADFAPSRAVKLMMFAGVAIVYLPVYLHVLDKLLVT